MGCFTIRIRTVIDDVNEVIRICSAEREKVGTRNRGDGRRKGGGDDGISPERKVAS
jgi:hypothetical protein